MNKGDLFTVYLNGVMMTVCVLGFYSEEYSGEDMVILAVVNQEDMVYLPLGDLQALFPRLKQLH
ncbi:MAG: hypothetical protein PHG94_01535 [Syntrophomonas sp.]|uniref:hypothetical protein n=1 Tax=Syntrophomonas sp. TaxID=2053627 RepID=UPI002636F00B|nr:hypothetical protein [Syntrophomonas sp.]MDD2509806.1 hypothetical protein [Syntrophomonas sp.]MDD4625634.1 hypothetical protein [Syntrophomonas sp.]